MSTKIIEPCYAEFGRIVRHWRNIDVRLTQEEAAKYLKVTRNHLAQIEIGRCRVQLHVILRILKTIHFSETLAMRRMRDAK